MEDTVNYNLHKIIKWLNINNLIIYLGKTNMTFDNTILIQTCISIYNGKKIKEIIDTKFLDLHINNHLTWKSYIYSNVRN